MEDKIPRQNKLMLFNCIQYGQIRDLSELELVQLRHCIMDAQPSGAIELDFLVEACSELLIDGVNQSDDELWKTYGGLLLNLFRVPQYQHVLPASLLQHLLAYHSAQALVIHYQVNRQYSHVLPLPDLLLFLPRFNPSMNLFSMLRSMLINPGKLSLLTCLEGIIRVTIRFRHILADTVCMAISNLTEEMPFLWCKEQDEVDELDEELYCIIIKFLLVKASAIPSNKLEENGFNWEKNELDKFYQKWREDEVIKLTKLFHPDIASEVLSCAWTHDLEPSYFESDCYNSQRHHHDVGLKLMVSLLFLHDQSKQEQVREINLDKVVGLIHQIGYELLMKNKGVRDENFDRLGWFMKLMGGLRLFYRQELSSILIEEMKGSLQRGNVFYLGLIVRLAWFCSNDKRSGDTVEYFSWLKRCLTKLWGNRPPVKASKLLNKVLLSLLPDDPLPMVQQTMNLIDRIYPNHQVFDEYRANAQYRLRQDTIVISDEEATVTTPRGPMEPNLPLNKVLQEYQLKKSIPRSIQMAKIFNPVWFRNKFIPTLCDPPPSAGLTKQEKIMCNELLKLLGESLPCLPTALLVKELDEDAIVAGLLDLESILEGLLTSSDLLPIYMHLDTRLRELFNQLGFKLGSPTPLNMDPTGHYLTANLPQSPPNQLSHQLVQCLLEFLLISSDQEVSDRVVQYLEQEPHLITPIHYILHRWLAELALTNQLTLTASYFKVGMVDLPGKLGVLLNYLSQKLPYTFQLPEGTNQCHLWKLAKPKSETVNWILVIMIEILCYRFHTIQTAALTYSSDPKGVLLVESMFQLLCCSNDLSLKGVLGPLLHYIITMYYAAEHRPPLTGSTSQLDYVTWVHLERDRLPGPITCDRVEALYVHLKQTFLEEEDPALSLEERESKLALELAPLIISGLEQVKQDELITGLNRFLVHNQTIGESSPDPHTPAPCFGCPPSPGKSAEEPAWLVCTGIACLLNYMEDA